MDTSVSHKDSIKDGISGFYSKELENGAVFRVDHHYCRSLVVIISCPVKHQLVLRVDLAARDGVKRIGFVVEKLAPLPI